MARYIFFFIIINTPFYIPGTGVGLEEYSIEYWFLLHYANINRYFGTSKAVIEELVRHRCV